eukprot:65668-Prymnesium_polylepis.1
MEERGQGPRGFPLPLAAGVSRPPRPRVRPGRARAGATEHPWSRGSNGTRAAPQSALNARNTVDAQWRHVQRRRERPAPPRTPHRHTARPSAPPAICGGIKGTLGSQQCPS